MKDIKVLKKIIIIILGIFTLPVFTKFEDIFDVGDYIMASSMVIYVTVLCLALNALIWGMPSFRLMLALSIICNSSSYAYTMYKRYKRNERSKKKIK